MPLPNGYIPLQIAGEIDGTLKDTDACVPVKANLAGITDGQALVYNAALNAIIPGNAGGSLGSPSVFIGQLSQAGGAAPTVTQTILDTITGISFTRFGAGIYTVTKTGAWLANKIHLLITPNTGTASYPNGTFMAFARGNNNDLNIYTSTGNGTTGVLVPTDGMLQNTPIMILLYP